MVDSENIILAVKKYKAIWDLDDEGYHNKNLKDDAWDGVCLNLISDWNILSGGDKYIKQLEVKKKWNNIRDYYKKLLSEQQPGEQVRAKKRRYLYSDILEFIRPVYDKKLNKLDINNSNDSNLSTHSANNESDEHVQNSENDTRGDMETVTFIGIPTKNPAPKQLNPVTRPKHRITRTASKMKKQSTLSVFERSVLRSLEKRSSSIDDDSDLLFLKSLLPDMKTLTPSQKLDFKLGIMELYRNIVNASNDQHNANHDHDYDLDRLSDAQVKVETVRLSVDEDSYESS